MLEWMVEIEVTSLLVSNRDQRGNPAADDDRVMRLLIR